MSNLCVPSFRFGEVEHPVDFLKSISRKDVMEKGYVTFPWHLPVWLNIRTVMDTHIDDDSQCSFHLLHSDSPPLLRKLVRSINVEMSWLSRSSLALAVGWMMLTVVVYPMQYHLWVSSCCRYCCCLWLHLPFHNHHVLYYVLYYILVISISHTYSLFFTLYLVSVDIRKIRVPALLFISHLWYFSICVFSFISLHFDPNSYWHGHINS